MSRTYRPLASRTLTAAEVLAKHRFVKSGGAYADAGDVATGISDEAAAAIGDTFSAITHGTALLEVSGAIAQDGLIVPDADGKGKAASTLIIDAGATPVVGADAIGTMSGSTSDEHVRCIAMAASAADGDIIEVMLI